MRDIPKINYNTSMKNKKIANENDTNGVLTKCTFKSYKDFLENYESKNTKDDQESISSTDSGISDIKSYNTSNCSLNSENGSTKVDSFSSRRTGSFRNYLENYNSKKFSSVKPITNKPNVIKSEIVIQVNAPQEFVRPQEERDIPDFPPPPPPLELPEEIAPVSAPAPPPLLPPIPPTIPPPPPPLDVSANHYSPKKWAPVEIENRHVQEKQVSKNSSAAATNLAAILTQNALFKRKAHESEKVIECKPVQIEKTPTPPQPVANHNTLPRAKAPEFINHRTITIEVPNHSPPKLLDDVDYSTTTVVPITDRNAKVKTNDPNVKKMVYSTYRGLLGAYNNKANDMIATLPRNTMVKEDRGISKQLKSIALQGGLERLNGRTNPKVEME